MVEPILALEDNYIWMFKTGDHTMAAIDPGEADPVIQYLENQVATLSHILLTHHHHDHVGGTETLRKRFGSVVVGASEDQDRLPPLDLAVSDGQQCIIGMEKVNVMTVPGHTLGHVVYRVRDALFSGDTLFRFGCGRLFEGSPEQMWESLLKMRALPDATRLYAGHEYTQINLAFACALEPNNTDLRAIMDDIARQTNMGQPTMPCFLGEEKQYNPFLKADNAAFAKSLGLKGDAPQSVFATLRKKRNHF